MAFILKIVIQFYGFLVRRGFKKLFKRPWRDFVWPLSVPSANEGCSRLSANVFHFQTNYFILFVVELVLSILTQPSALMCIIVCFIAWVLFLKKNEEQHKHTLN